MSNLFRQKLLVAAAVTAAFAGHASAQTAAKPPVSVVLVHGAFENSSVWAKVVAAEPPGIFPRRLVAAWRDPASNPVQRS